MNGRKYGEEKKYGFRKGNQREGNYLCLLGSQKCFNEDDFSRLPTSLTRNILKLLCACSCLCVCFYVRVPSSMCVFPLRPRLIAFMCTGVAVYVWSVLCVHVRFCCERG